MIIKRENTVRKINIGLIRMPEEERHENGSEAVWNRQDFVQNNLKTSISIKKFKISKDHK